jgi:hypothetical protein
MGENINRAVLYLAATVAREAVLNWEKTLLAALIIKEFGASGAKFVGYVGYEITKSNIEMTLRIGKRFGQTIGADIYAKSRFPQTIARARVLAPASVATVAIGVGAYALAKSPDVTYDFFSDTSNYGTDKEGNLYVHPLILQGATVN